jgi:hypothetical protein
VREVSAPASLRCGKPRTRVGSDRT